MQQQTIFKAVEAVGIGLHKGDPIKLRLEPLNENAGIVFYREDLAVSIELSPFSVIDTRMATVIGLDNATISTIEHFLSAVYAYGIDNLRVIVNGNEMPIMDGSAIAFCYLLDEAGIQKQNASKKVIHIKKPIEVTEGEKFARLLPSDHAMFDFKIHFNHPVIGKQEEVFHFSRQNFVKEIARARTFGFINDIQMLQAQGLAKGASLQNAIGLDENKVLNPEGLRFENEFARHKILDAMGDLRVLGYNILGKYESFAGSHALNAKLTRALLEKEDAYEVVEVDALESISFAKSFA
jgi:UDP-3-O-[3-hydroxymyristoyl] N-acetylglucosamine deacetylase